MGVIGFFISGLATILYINGSSVYPGLLLRRLFYSIGGSAITAMIPAMLAELTKTTRRGDYHPISDAQEGTTRNDQNDRIATLLGRYNGKIAGLVGLCSGLGAVVAVSVLLPIPTWVGRSPEDSLHTAFYIVGTAQIFTSFLLFWGLYKSDEKGFRSLFSRDTTIFEEAALDLTANQTGYVDSIKEGFVEMKKDKKIFLSYVGSFVARAASIGIALFIPLWVNMWYHKTNKCEFDVNDPASEVKKNCYDAYVQAAILAGISNLFALIFAPLWGVLSDYIGQRWAIICTGLTGTIACIGTSFVSSPKSPFAYVLAVLLGTSQIGAIITSMALCTSDLKPNPGAISGVYSLFGGIGILLITKLGGWFSDRWQGAPFFMLGVFFAVYAIASFCVK